MPAIPEFQQQRLASSAVGTPGVDPTAGAAFGAIASAADTARGFVAKKQQALNETEANNRNLDMN